MCVNLQFGLVVNQPHLNSLNLLALTLLFKGPQEFRIMSFVSFWVKVYERMIMLVVYENIKISHAFT